MLDAVACIVMALMTALALTYVLGCDRLKGPRS